MNTATAVVLEGVFNARAFGQPDPWLVRSSALDALTRPGLDALRGLGVQRVVDLREPGEGPDGAHDLDVIRIPIYRLDTGVPVTGRIETIYDRVLDERADALVEAVSAIADAPGPVAVHCTIGKDRTGLVVALALLTAGVSKSDVVADYVRSGPEVLPHRRELVERVLAGLALDEAGHAEAWRLNVDSPPEVMHHLFARLRRWDGAAGYLLAHGLETSQVEALRARVRPR